MKIFSATLTFLLFLNTVTSGQVLFERTYGNLENSKQTNSIIYHSDAVLLTGYITNESNDGEDLLLVKLDTLSNLIWQKQIGGIKNERGTKIKSVADGYLIAGHTKSIGNGNQDFYFIKTDFEGNLLWERTYGTGNLEYCVDFVVTTDGGFLLIGTGVKDETNGEDWWLVKTDEAGDIEWTNYYGTDGLDNPTLIKTLSDGNFMIGGGYRGQHKLLKIDSDGNIIWDFGTIGNDFFNSKIVDAIELENEEIIFTYWESRPQYTKLSNSGEFIYTQPPVSGPPSFDTPLKLQIINQDSILLLNRSRIFSFTPDTGDTTGLYSWNNNGFSPINNNNLFVHNNNYFTVTPHFDNNVNQVDGFSSIKYNQDFELATIYSDTFEFNDYVEYAKKTIETNSGDFIILGNQKEGNSNLNKNILLTKTDSEGIMLNEVAIDKGDYAEPMDMMYSDEENLILLTQFPEDTLELSMIDTNGITLWSHIYIESYESSASGKNVVLTSYPGDQFLLVLRGREYYIFDETGFINTTFINNAPTGGLPLDVKILQDGRILYFTKENMILLDQNGSWISTTYLRPNGYEAFEYFDFHYLSDDNIWLVGKARMDVNDLASSVIMQVNLEGTRLSEVTFDALPYDDFIKLNIIDADNERIIVYGNDEQPWIYLEEENVTRYNCLTKPLNTSFLEEWSVDGEIVSRIDFGVGDGAQLSDMIISSDNNFVGTGWFYKANSDDQYLVKVDRDDFVPSQELDFTNNTSFSVYPNPGSTFLSIDLNTVNTGNATIQFFNTTGQLLKTEAFKKESVETSIEINTSVLPKGIYFIQVDINNEWTSSKKWIKLN